jgi:hypothetical protein
VTRSTVTGSSSSVSACIALAALVSGCNPSTIDLDLPPRDAGLLEIVDAYRPPRDGGPPDAGTDAGLDAGQDAGRDAGPACFVSGGACDPFADDPCGRGRTCISDQDEITRCVTSAFTLRAEGDSCSVDNQCQERLECRAALGAPLRCMRQCRIGSVGECGPDGRCIVLARSSDRCLGLCAPVDQCDLFAPSCDAGRTCILVGDPESEVGEVMLCAPPGATPVGSACPYADSCVAGAGCIGGICEELCRTTADCSTGTCIGRSGSEIGTCG